MSNLKFGCDPEFFCVDKNNNVLSPAILERNYNLFPILDHEKHPIYFDDGKDFSWMMDGVAFELTIKHPCGSAKEMKNITDCALETLDKLIHNLDSNLSLYTKPVVNIETKNYLPFLNEEKVYQGFIFGCDPDEDAIVSDYECKTVDVNSHTLRYGGGHIHISGIPELEFIIPAIKLLAITVGNYCIANSPYPELEKLRAQTYGRPGRYRYQHYKNGETGLEYRTPSNSWVSLTEEKYTKLFSWVEKAMEFLVNKRVDIIETYLPDTIQAITNADQKISNNILYSLEG